MVSAIANCIVFNIDEISHCKFLVICYEISILISGLFSAIGTGKDASIDFFDSWVTHVKNTVPSDRLLVFEAKQGWNPLCEFLDLPIPIDPYPHVNDAASMLTLFKILRLISYTTIYIIPCFISLLLTYTLLF